MQLSRLRQHPCIFRRNEDVNVTYLGDILSKMTDGLSNMTEMDGIDRELLTLLQADAREPTSSIARKLGISRSTVQSRMARLESRGIVGGYTVRLNDAYSRSQVKAHVLITFAPKLAPRIGAELKKIPEVISLYSISGAHDMIAIVAAPDTTHMDEVIDQIGAVPGIDRTTTSVVLSTKFER